MKKDDLEEHQAILEETRRAVEFAQKNQQENEKEKGENSFSVCDSIYIDSWLTANGSKNDSKTSSPVDDIEKLAEELMRHHSEYAESRDTE